MPKANFFAKEVKFGVVNTYEGSVSKNKLTKAKNEVKMPSY